MKNHPDIKLFATTKRVADGVPSMQWSETLLAQADQEIELRVKTPFTTVSQLEKYAQDIAQVSNRVLLAVRQADWYKPYVQPTCPHPILCRKWMRWTEEQEQKRRQNPRIKIVDQEFGPAIEAAQDKAFRLTHKRQRTNHPSDLLAEWVTVERVIWLARELLGVTEITLLPKVNAHPITTTFATHEAMEYIYRGIDLLAERNKPLVAAREIISGPGAAVQALRAHNTRRNALYRAQWEQFCSQEGNYAFNPVRPCICRTPARNFSEYVEQWSENLHNPQPHQPRCHERMIEVLTYWSDWSLAESHAADAIGQRHSLIAYNLRDLKKLQREAAEEK